MKNGPDYIDLTGGEIDPGSGMVCMLLSDPLIKPDNVTGVCNDCGRAVQLRPGSMAAAMEHKMILLCLECVPARTTGGTA